MSQSLAQKLRYKLSAKNITAILVFGAIVLVFVFFGMPSKMGGGGVGSMARVNDALISVKDFKDEEQRIQRIQEYYAQMFGQPTNFGPERQKEMRKQAIQSLVHMELLNQASESQGIRATTSEIIDQIKQTPAFQQNGKFQSDMYFRLLEANRLTPSDYESKVRKEVQQNRAMKIFEISSAPINLEIEKQKALKEVKWNIGYVKINADTLAKSLPGLDAEAKKQLQNPEFAKKVEEEFKANAQEYKKEEKVKAQHILIAVKPGDADSDAKALEKIKELKKRAEKEDFGKLASQYSEDPGSKAKKGDLGAFPRGAMVPEFDAVAFSAPVGSVSDPVKTQFGYHLIKVNERAEGGFEAMKTKVAEKILARQALDAKIKAIEDVLAKGDDSAIQNEVKALGLNWEETGFFDLGTEYVPKLEAEALTQAVFQLSPEKKYSSLVRSGADKYILKFKDSKTETAALPGSEKDMIKQRRASQMLESWVDEFRKTSVVEINSHMITQ